MSAKRREKRITDKERLDFLARQRNPLMYNHDEEGWGTIDMEGWRKRIRQAIDAAIRATRRQSGEDGKK